MTYLKRKSSEIKYPVVILCDDREKKPWHLDDPKFIHERKRLKVGDYSIEGFEDTIAIERKSGLQELFANLNNADRPRFKKFLYKLSKHPVKCIVVEDSMSNIESAARIVAKRSQLTAQTLYYWISVITIRYQIPMLFIGKRKSQQQALLYHLFTEALKQTCKL